jgi:amino acid transporter
VPVATQSRILDGMAHENVVPAVFARIHPARRSPYVAPWPVLVSRSEQ